MSNITITDPNVMTIMAKKVASSGMFGFKNENQAYTLMLIAESEGVHPMKAIQQFHIINGKPALKSTEVLSRFQKSGGKVEWIITNDTEAKGKFTHPDGGTITIEWTIEKATKAGLLSNPVWGKYPSNMLRARCVTDAVNAIYPACLGGCMTQSQAEDIPVEEIEEVEIEEVDEAKEHKVNIQLLETKLKKEHSFNDAMVKEFSTEYDLVNNEQRVSRLLNENDLLTEKVDDFNNK